MIRPRSSLIKFVFVLLATIGGEAGACVNKILEPGFFDFGKWKAELSCVENVQKVSVTGVNLVVRSQSEPWTTLSKLSRASQIQIRSKTIDFREKLALPGAFVRMEAEAILFRSKGALDVTPLTPPRAAYLPGAERGADGAAGLPGSRIDVIARSVRVEGNTLEARLIANGGAGQDAGEGADGAEQSRLLGVTPNVPVIQVSQLRNPVLRRAYREDLSSLIYVGDHYNLCQENGNCDPGNEKTEIVVAETPLIRPMSGRNALPGGMPGIGGAGGSVWLSVVDMQNVPGRIASVEAGRAGRPDRLRKGEPAGQPNPAIAIHFTEYKIAVREVFTQADGQDAPAPNPTLPASKRGEFYRLYLPAFP